MKKLFLLLLIVPFLWVGSCSSDDSSGSTGVSVTGVSLNKNTLTLTVGKREKLTATVMPANAENKAIIWSTSNNSVATVSAGTVIAQAEGTAIITVESRADSTKKAQCTVTVNPRPVTDIGAKDGLSGKTATEYIAEKKVFIGWNLGNAFDAGPGEGSWTKPVIKDLLIEVKDAGFSAIRIPITWNGTNRPIGAAPDYKLDQVELDRVAEVVDWAYDVGLVTIINIHHDSWLSITQARQSDENRTRITEQFKKVWEQLAEKFKDYGDWLIFEPFNEIHNGGWGWGDIPDVEFDIINEWNRVFTETVRAAGEKNAQRFLIVQPYCAKPHQAMSDKFIIPTDSATGKQIVSIHYYDPENFALNGQTVNWGTEVDKANLTNGSGQIPGFAEFKTKFTSKGIPVIIGESGATYQAARTGEERIKADANRILYLDYMCRQAKENGMIPIIWDNGNITGQSSRPNGEAFGLFDRNTGEPFPEMEIVINTMVNAVQ
jgi:aryl-phospho-beta-D-glucosidase BglC (GH1 family)